MYDYRKMTGQQRAEIVEYRRRQHRPWHSPPHWDIGRGKRFLISAACYKRAPVIGKHPQRTTQCEENMLSVCREFCEKVFAWCVLPNHYHVLVETEHLEELCSALGEFHGRSSYCWNDEDDLRGRQVWYRCFDRAIRSDRHLWATVNYEHHNPVFHGYAEKWQD